MSCPKCYTSHSLTTYASRVGSTLNRTARKYGRVRKKGYYNATDRAKKSGYTIHDALFGSLKHYQR